MGGCACVGVCVGVGVSSRVKVGLYDNAQLSVQFLDVPVCCLATVYFWFFVSEEQRKQSATSLRKSCYLYQLNNFYSNNMASVYLSLPIPYKKPEMHSK